MKTSTREISKACNLCLVFLFGAAVVMLPTLAFAGKGPSSSVCDAMCLLAEAFRGEIAAGISTVAVCTIGALACVGRVQWTTALLVAVGIGTMFGASNLVVIAYSRAYGGENCMDYNFKE